MEYQRTPIGSKKTQIDFDIVLNSITNFMLVSAFINLSGYMIVTPLREKIVTYSILNNFI